MDALSKIDKQIELEMAASTLYSHLKENAEEKALKDFWARFSIQETYHASALGHLKKTLSPVEIAREAAALDEELIDKLMKETQKFISEAKAGVSMERSFEIALFMEFSELNSIFLKAEEKEEKSTSLYIHSMGEGTRSHLLTLCKGVKTFLGEDSQVPLMEKFNELGLTPQA